jgi:hypothetical protein
MRFIEYFTAATALAASAMFGASISKSTPKASNCSTCAEHDMAATRRFFERLSNCTTLIWTANVHPEALGSPEFVYAVREHCASMAGQDTKELMSFIREVMQDVDQVRLAF